MSTNLSNFNSKVNLAKVVKQFPEYNDWLLQEVKPYGEFVSNADFSSVCNIFDIWIDKDKNQLLSSEIVFEDITTKYPHLLKDPVIFNNYKQKTIGEAERMEKLWRSVVEHSQTELNSKLYPINESGGKISLGKYFTYSGYPGVVENKFGHISENTRNLFNTMQKSWLKLHGFSKPIIVPYYYTPKHISYIEVFDALDESTWENRRILYRNEYAGFAGTRGHILPDFKALMNRQGCLWNYTLDYWNKTVVTIDEDCPIWVLLHIYKTAKLTKFAIDPLDIIKDKNLGSLVEPYLKDLSKEQVRVLQEKLEYTDLLDKWKNIKSTSYAVGDITYFKRPEGYFYIYKGKEFQLTNFSITLVDRIKKDDKPFYILDIIQGDKTITFEIPQTKFNSRLGLINHLRELFYDCDLEPPKIYQPSGEHKLMNFIFDYFDS
jgi:hypothetical protein